MTKQIVCDSCGYEAPDALSGKMVINHVTYAKLPINWWFDVAERKVICSVCIISISDEEIYENK